METLTFVNMLLKRGCELLNYHPYWQFRHDVGLCTKRFNFPCNIKDGLCERSKVSLSSAKKRGLSLSSYPYTVKQDLCCCEGCAKALGHFGHKWPNNIKTLSYYAEKYTKKDGFWRSTGCILPTEMRSLVCSNFVCYTVEDEFARINTAFAGVLHNRIIRYNQIPSIFSPERDRNEIKTVTKRLDNAKVAFSIDEGIWHGHKIKSIVLKENVKTYNMRVLFGGGSYGETVRKNGIIGKALHKKIDKQSDLITLR